MNSIDEDTIDQANADETLSAAGDPVGRDRPDFPLGRVVITTNALERLDPYDCIASLARHAGGDWGDVCDEDREQNEWALRNDARLLSVYTDRVGRTFWIITEADRSATTILMPDDY